MIVPGFTAEASIYKTGGRHRMLGSMRQKDGAVYPAVTCDWTCLDDCLSNCPDPSDCYDVPPRYRAACLRWVRTCNLRCHRLCCH